MMMFGFDELTAGGLSVALKEKAVAMNSPRIYSESAFIFMS
jgi:hypothetical protein